jgi:hypothetical protein
VEKEPKFGINELKFIAKKEGKKSPKGIVKVGA